MNPPTAISKPTIPSVIIITMSQISDFLIKVFPRIFIIKSAWITSAKTKVPKLIRKVKVIVSFVIVLFFKCGVWNVDCFAQALGFEPRLTVLETVVLPLNYAHVKLQDGSPVAIKTET